MDEPIRILDHKGNPTGKIALKSEAHRKGWFHPTVHIWFYTPKGELLLQQRSASKTVYPLLWDVSVAGHIGAKEDIHTAAIREIEEEIGLSTIPENLEKIGIFKSIQRPTETIVDREFHHTYLCPLKVKLNQLQRQESEVASLKLISLSQFESSFQSPIFVPHNNIYYETIIDHVKRKL